MWRLVALCRQQAWPHDQPSSHFVFSTPLGQPTLQLPVEMQRTRHVPLHVTLQLPTDVHVTSLAAPTVGAQSFTLSHA